MLRIATALITCAFLDANPLKVENFPEINQRMIVGAENRCGTIALSSWILWLAENGYPELAASRTTEIGSPFESAALPEDYRPTLTQFDRLCGGTGEIRLTTLAGALIEYVHQLDEHPLEVALFSYNLPDEATLRELLASGAATVLLHGIYREDSATGRLQRITGHYTCLVGENSSTLIANTYAQNYQFTLQELPMGTIQSKDRYRPVGTESQIALKYPKNEYPHYSFRSFAPKDSNVAQFQSILEGPRFAESDEKILLEGAVALWVKRKNPPKDAETEPL